MKKTYLFTIMLFAMAIAFTSCNQVTVLFTEEDLFGKWENDNNHGEYWVYQSDTDQTGDYFWGKTWDENDDNTEELLNEDYHGNGWFKWQLDVKDLTQIHMMNVSETQIPKIYTITLLTDSKLQYQRTTLSGQKQYYSFTKVR